MIALRIVGMSPPRRQVHHRVRPVVHRVMQLLQLFVNVRGRRRVPDVRVDLALERDADAHRLQRLVMKVRGNNRPPARHFAAHQFRLNLFAPRHVLHLFRDDALAGVVHLRNISCAVGRRCFLQPLLNPSVSHSHGFPLKTLRPQSISPDAELSHRRARAATRAKSSAAAPDFAVFADRTVLLRI